VTRDQPMTTDLLTELEVARAYASIEELRLGDRCRFDFMVDPDAMHCRMPGLSLQPLLENAVRHGAANHAGKYSILLTASFQDDMLHVTIINGPIEQSTRQVGTAVIPVRGHALHNIGERLHILFGAKAQLKVEITGPASGSCSLTVPQYARSHRDE
jgi:sensor histidine kinase YesM